MKVQIKRIYEEPEESDGYRVLVDRLWPQGVSKEKTRLDDWVKELPPLQNYGNGLITIRKNGRSLKQPTGKNF